MEGSTCCPYCPFNRSEDIPALWHVFVGVGADRMSLAVHREAGKLRSLVLTLRRVVPGIHRNRQVIGRIRGHL